ncbi:MAG: hypothetical protein ABSF61_06650 [Anaerolineales bacterium]|jgi:hypothetical protein
MQTEVSVAPSETQIVSSLQFTTTGLVALHGPGILAIALSAIAQLAVRRGPVWVVDGGNCFDALWIARHIAVSGLAPGPALGRIHISRAFTCHQLVERLLSLSPYMSPLVVLGLLDTFYDENIRLEEVRRLLNRTWPTLHSCSRASLVVVTLQLPEAAAQEGRAQFYHTFVRLADRAVSLTTEPEATSQLPLWR